MDQIIELLSKIASLPKSRIDRNYLQGYTTFKTHIEAVVYKEKLSDSEIWSVLTSCQKYVEEANQYALPYNLPIDYRFFLQYCGGLSISNERYYVSINGVGPQASHLYAALMNEEDSYIPTDDGMFQIGSISLHKKQEYIDLVLDLSGVIQEATIIGISNRLLSEVGKRSLLENPQVYGGKWRILGNNFMEFLNFLAVTWGSLEYDEPWTD